VTSAVMVKLRDLGEWTGGNTPSKANSAYWANGTVPWVSPKDMKVDEIASSQDRVTEAALNEGRVSIVPEGSVLFVTRSGILSHTLPVAVTKAPVTINQDLKALTPRAGVLPKYVAHAVRGASRRILKECSKHGTTVASIETSALLDFEVPLVAVERQRRIVAEIEKQFSRLDEAVANLEHAKTSVKRYKAAVLEAAVEGRLVACYDRASSSDRALPGGWRWLTVGDVARVGTGATPNRSNPNYWGGGDIPWVTSAAVNEPYVDQPSEYVTRTALAETNLTVYPPGTLLVAMYGEGKTRGKCTELRIAAATNQALAALEVDPSVRSYLKLVLEHSYEKLRNVASGGVQPNLNLRLVRSLRVPLPPKEEQERIVAEVDRRLSIVREVESEVVANLKRAQALRQAVLASAFASASEAVPSSA